jgi:L-2-hydroxyglutarate oxidase LhgO
MDVEVIVAGAGVVGLAIAQRLAADGREVWVLEQEPKPGQHASSRNSEVIHAGIYYAPGSAKAKLCREGRDLLYAWCAEHGVEHRQIGKILVAVEEDERPALERLHANARANGVELEPLGRKQVHSLEPTLRAVCGLFSRATGIIDSHGLMQSYEAVLQAHGGRVSCRSRIDRVTIEGDGLRVEGEGHGERFALRCRWLVNSAGLFAQALASRIEGIDPTTIPRLHLCQGRYFSYGGRSPFQHLVYPMPEANTSGLGVHATLDLGGQLRFGPDVRYCDEIDYRVDESLRDAFARAVQRYWPDCEAEKLQPGYAGVRAKLAGPGEPAGDFVLQGESDHAVRGLVNLFGIESPGLTASLAIANEVAPLLER